MSNKEKIFKWLESVGSEEFDELMIDYLIDKCGMEEIVNYYCNDMVSYAIENYSCKDKIQMAFAELWALSRNISIKNFLFAFLTNTELRVINNIVDAGFDTLEKLRKVNYEELLNIPSIKESEAKNFIEEFNYYSNEMNAVLNTNRINIKRKN